MQSAVAAGRVFFSFFFVWSSSNQEKKESQHLSHSHKKQGLGPFMFGGKKLTFQSHTDIASSQAHVKKSPILYHALERW